MSMGITILTVNAVLFSKSHFTVGVWGIVFMGCSVVSVVLFILASRFSKAHREICLKISVFAVGCTFFLFVIKLNIWGMPLFTTVAVGATILFLVVDAMYKKLPWINKYYSFTYAITLQGIRTGIGCAYIFHLIYGAYWQTLNPENPVEFVYVISWSACCLLESVLCYKQHFLIFTEYKVEFINREPENYFAIKRIGSGMLELIKSKDDKEIVSASLISKITYSLPYNWGIVIKEPKDILLKSAPERVNQFDKTRLLKDNWVICFVGCKNERKIEVSVFGQERILSCK